jgi:predicted lipid-binding transport protein (Tim44 family)
MVRFRHLFALLAVAATLSFVVSEADARVGRGGSMGSRGARTYSAPPPTATAPSTASPFQRSTTQPSTTRPTTSAPAATSPGLAGRPGGMFGGGLLGGLAAGFIGAGLFGMLFGHGFMGGLGGFASFIGLLLQIGLVIIVARLAWAWWQRRSQSQPAFAGMSPRDNMTSTPGDNTTSNMSGGFFGLGSKAAEPAEAPLEVSPEDFDDFERLLGEVQEAYSAEDTNALREHVTPEMLTYMLDDLRENASNGIVNKVSDVKLLQGDLSEGWSDEDGADYVSVAMRFSLVDRTLDRDTGKLVEGSTSPTEAKEVWTFRREPGQPWMLSGIQQT